MIFDHHRPVWFWWFCWTFCPSVTDLHVLDWDEELCGRDPPLVRRAHAVPSELLRARTDAARPAGKTATAARKREPGGRRGAGEGGEDTLGCLYVKPAVTETNMTLIWRQEFSSSSQIWFPCVQNARWKEKPPLCFSVGKLLKQSDCGKRSEVKRRSGNIVKEQFVLSAEVCEMFPWTQTAAGSESLEGFLRLFTLPWGHIFMLVLTSDLWRSVSKSSPAVCSLPHFNSFIHI